MNKELKIMDVTLRDGSYAVDFQISCALQRLIGVSLEKLGYEYLEIGHGMGLEASNPKNGIALHTDEEYLSNAQTYLKKIKYGMFCIPGVASIESLELLKKYGASFVRIGTNANEVELSEKYVQKAKQLGLEVMTNYMKSYTVSPEQFSEQVKKSESYGADVIYIVDSSGSMQPEQIEMYYDAVKKVSNLKVGFHGHDNLGMALTNSLKAAELGISFIDASLQGLGRSSGNVSTELFTINAMKQGYDLNIDVKRLLLISKKLVYPLVNRKGINPLDVMCGVSEFHTSYLKYVHEVAGYYGISPLDLIEAYASEDKTGINLERMRAIAQGLPEDLDSFSDINFIGYFGNEQK